MATFIKFDVSSLVSGVKKLTSLAEKQKMLALKEVADEVMRLSSFEVPHDTGMLENSGSVQQNLGAESYLVGYNRVYAARLHEHPEYNFRNGRKGKYLEDPIKKNLTTFRDYFGQKMREIFK